MEPKVNLRFVLLGSVLFVLFLCVVVLAADLSLVLLGPNEASEWTELEFNRSPPLDPIPHYSREEMDCFQQRKVYFDGNCWVLQERGPCPEGNWLILESLNHTAYTGVKPICAPRRCESDSAFWNATGECIRAKNGPRICTKKETSLQVDALGFGACKCVKGAARVMNSNGACYRLYSRGFCDPGYVVGVDYNAEEYPAICVPDECKSPSPDTIILPYKGSCYPEESNVPCSEGKVLTVDVHSGLPTCKLDLITWHLIQPEPLCSKVDRNENCADKIKYDLKNMDNFILDINNDINKHKGFSVSKKG